jgi:cytochrome c oxidase cbb3-type subunit 3
MNEPNDPLLMDHEADGIRELDNKLPRWWVWLFWGCNLFAVFYLGYYHVLAKGPAATEGQMVAEYNAEMAIGNAIKSAALARFEQEMEALEPSKDPALLAEGERLYTQMCAPCHRPDAGGLVGPNLTDDYWIHGPAFKDNLKVIYNGVPDKGMVTWKTLLKPAEIHAVASYVYTKRGSNPPNPKPREDLAPKDTGPNEYE